jgi:hypothetical protein
VEEAEGVLEVDDVHRVVERVQRCVADMEMG